MATRSLNKVLLIGNLTRDPELRYTPQGTAVVTFGLATNRSWVTDSGERREETEFHRIVAWNKLAELCAQLLFKGRRVYVEGRLSTRRFVGTDGQERQITEIVIDDMLVLDSRRMPGEEEAEVPGEPQQVAAPEDTSAAVPVGSTVPEGAPSGDVETEKVETEETKGKKATKKSAAGEENEVKPEDIPF